MSAQGWETVTALFAEARKRDGAARRVFVDEACRDDSTLRQMVEALLAAADRRERDEPGALGPKTRTAAPSDALGMNENADAAPAPTLAGRTIGAYLLIREIGQGGMGSVYLGVRDDGHFDKRVAIKVLRRGSSLEAELIRRFRRERQILAGLDHEYIARLLDGGTYDGLPYFVMEYVEGQTITHYCDSRRLSVAERLRLFIKVSEAVAYAHRNLVVHRDIKPSNILITSRGVPKLLDFGIAKLLNADLTRDGVAPTGMGIRAMTPFYASPEQVRGEPITTATDVYSLGVLLYEVVSGLRPYRVPSDTDHEIARAVCEQEPESPSTALRRVDMETTARTVQLPPHESGKRLRRRLAGDIDNIILKALRKEPQRRYGSVEVLAEDLERHLQGLPVRARADTLSYRLSKFARRNRMTVAAASLAAVSLIGGAITAGWQAREAERARDLAEARFNDVRQLASSFLFDFHDAIENLPGATPARELVVTRAREYLDSLAAESGDDPSLRLELATAYEKVGFIQWNRYYSNLGDTAGSLESQEHALAIRAEIAEGPPIDREASIAVARSYVLIGDILFETGDAPGALDAYRQSRALRESLAREAPERDLRFALAVSHERIGDTLGNPSFEGSLGDASGANAAYDEMQAIFERLVDEDPSDAAMQQSLSIGYEKRGDMMRGLDDWSAALGFYRRALEIRARLRDGEPNNARYLRNLAVAHAKSSDMLAALGQDAEALASQRRAVTLFESLAESDPSDVRASADLDGASGRLLELERQR